MLPLAGMLTSARASPVLGITQLKRSRKIGLARKSLQQSGTRNCCFWVKQRGHVDYAVRLRTSVVASINLQHREKLTS